MVKKGSIDPYTEAIGMLNRAKVRYVVIGMSGINYYAQKPELTFSTQDYDIFIKPTIQNVKKAISVFQRLKYSLISNKKQLLTQELKDLVRDKKTILATDPYGITIELIMVISGYTFGQMEKGAEVFNVSNIPVKVGKFDKLLMSKKMAGRKKDKLFLERYEILLRDRIDSIDK
jgi:hypothetical protein